VGEQFTRAARRPERPIARTTRRSNPASAFTRETARFTFPERRLAQGRSQTDDAKHRFGQRAPDCAFRMEPTRRRAGVRLLLFQNLRGILARLFEKRDVDDAGQSFETVTAPALAPCKPLKTLKTTKENFGEICRSLEILGNRISCDSIKSKG